MEVLICVVWNARAARNVHLSYPKPISSARSKNWQVGHKVSLPIADLRADDGPRSSGVVVDEPASTHARAKVGEGIAREHHRRRRRGARTRGHEEETIAAVPASVHARCSIGHVTAARSALHFAKSHH
jgi:hypothetical protein